MSWLQYHQRRGCLLKCSSEQVRAFIRTGSQTSRKNKLATRSDSSGVGTKLVEGKLDCWLQAVEKNRTTKCLFTLFSSDETFNGRWECHEKIP